MKRHAEVAGFILAGGGSSRMGRDKGLLDFGGVPIIVRTARLLESLVAEVTVIGCPGRYSPLGLRAIADEAQVPGGPGSSGNGPLAGIAAALAVTTSPWNLIVACDLPYLSAEWLDWLLTRAVQSRGDVVVPRTARGIEPLAAVYRRECGPPISAALARGQRKVSDAVEELRLELVYPREWRRFDPKEKVLSNMNAPEDYEEARAWWTVNHPHDDERAPSSQATPKQTPQSTLHTRK